ncbi:MAG: molybdopterin cofactor-binding domain-containing protein [Bilophila wadsworthia]
MQHCHLETRRPTLHGRHAAYRDRQLHAIPHICRRVVGQALGIPWSSVRVIKPYIGGGFGNKQDEVLEPIVAFLTMKLDGAPVSMELTREECMLCTRVRHAFAMTARAGATKNGKLLGYGLDVLSNTGAYASHGHSIAAAGGSKVCYVYPHATYRFSAKTFYSNIPVGGACRGYGSPQTAYAIECLMDDTARALGMDPLDFRLKNTGRNGDISPLSSKPVATLGISDCLEEAAKSSVGRTQGRL